MVRFPGSWSREAALEPPQSDPDSPVAPAAEVLAGLLVRLEAFRDHPATLPLHDALYRALRGPGDGVDPLDVGAERSDLLAALAKGHPLEGEVRAALGLPPAVRSRGLRQILAEIPDLPVREDPVEALDLYLAAQRERIAGLERARQDLDLVVQRQGLLLSVAVGGAALLLILMALGFGLAPLWLGPRGPSASDVPEPNRPEERAGTTGAEGEHR